MRKEKLMRCPVIHLVLLAFVFTGITSAQTYDSSSGGYNTGYGTVYGSFGLAMATQNIYNSMQMNMQRTMMRSAMIKKWGRVAVEKAEANTRSGKTSTRASDASGPVVTQVPPIPKNYGTFRPDATVNTGKTIADALGDSPEEKQLYIKIYTATKEAYEKEAAAKGWKNSIAGAFTFFIVSNATVFQDATEEPNAEMLDALYQAINQSIDEVPEFGKMANRDKQSLYNTLIAFAGIPLATYAEGKQNGDESTVKIASQLAGQLIKLVLKIDADRIKISGGMITIS
ncbi:MAG: hypothetical protein KF756_04930 [Acidobacteria bacterium]|nr:hypothetical protein [Acidobacteriota bacterium]